MLARVLVLNVAVASSLNVLTTRAAHIRPRAAVRTDIIHMDELPLADLQKEFTPDRDKFWIEFEIPKKGIAEYGTAQVKLAPLLESSECVQVTYELPFGLSAEPRDGRVVVTKPGKGGEQEGDLLRFFSAWKQGAPQPDLVDVNQYMNRILPNGMMQPRSDGWENVVAKLCSNDGTYADSMVMIFERPL